MLTNKWDNLPEAIIHKIIQ